MPATHPEDIERDEDSFNLEVDGKPFELPVELYRSMRDLEAKNRAAFNSGFPSVLPARKAYDAVKAWKAEQGHGRGDGARGAHGGLDLGRVLGGGAAARPSTLTPALGRDQIAMKNQPVATTHGSKTSAAATSYDVVITPESATTVQKVHIQTDDDSLLLTNAKVGNINVLLPTGDSNTSKAGFPVSGLIGTNVRAPKLAEGWLISRDEPLTLTFTFSAANKSVWVAVETDPTKSTACAKS